MTKSSWPSLPPDEVQVIAEKCYRINQGREAMPDMGHESRKRQPRRPEQVRIHKSAGKEPEAQRRNRRNAPNRQHISKNMS